MDQVARPKTMGLNQIVYFIFIEYCCLCPVIEGALIIYFTEGQSAINNLTSLPIAALSQGQEPLFNNTLHQNRAI